MSRRRSLSLALAFFAMAWGSLPVSSQSTAPRSTIEVMPASEVKWEQLNPARGDKSPKAGTLWGDRTGRGPGGFLLRPVDGFRSPPHIHNIAYRGVVISGLIHNDDPKAVDMWMPAGSFWTQPAGEVHITAAKGKNALAYIEVEGAFGVLPAAKAFANKERPINADATNIVWLDASNSDWIQKPETSTAANDPKVAFLWGKPQGSQLNGTLIKLPANFTGTINSRGQAFRAVVIQGQAKHHGVDVKTLGPGSYFGSKGASEHRISCAPGDDCIIYVRTAGNYVVNPTK